MPLTTRIQIGVLSKRFFNNHPHFHGLLQISSVSRLESGMATLTLEPCELGVFWAPLLNLFGPILDDAKFTFDWEVADDISPVMVDKRLMEQAFAI